MNSSYNNNSVNVTNKDRFMHTTYTNFKGNSVSKKEEPKREEYKESLYRQRPQSGVARK